MKGIVKFFLGVLIGIFISGMAVVGFGFFAFNSREMRMLLLDFARNLSVASGDGGSEESVSTTTGAAINWEEVMAKSGQIYTAIDSYYLNEIDNEKIQDGMYKGLVDSLGDQYTVYYNEEEYKEFALSSSGTYYGIGVVVSQDPSTGVITVVRTFTKGSGYEEGMQAGDIIYKVEGESIEGQELSKVVTKIKGEEGTYVNVTVLRGGKEIEFRLERRKLEIDTVEYRIEEEDGKKIGYIAVSQFDEVTSAQFRTALDALEKDGMEGLVIDLRDNPGGLLDVTCDMLDRMLPKGVIVYTLDKNGKKVVEESTDKEKFSKPVAILVNGNSASASEVFSGAMRDYDAATLIGTKTFGKGIVQSIVPLGDGSAIKVTVSKYYTPDGIDIHGTGIEPDIVEELDEKAKEDGKVERSEDNQLDKAIEVVLDKIK